MSILIPYKKTAMKKNRRVINNKKVLEKWKADKLKSLTKRSEGLSIKNVVLVKVECIWSAKLL